MQNKRPFILKSILIILVIVTFICVTIFIGSISFFDSFNSDRHIQNVKKINVYFHDYIDFSVENFFNYSKVLERKYQLEGDFANIAKEIDYYDQENNELVSIVFTDEDHTEIHLSNDKGVMVLKPVGHLKEGVSVGIVNAKDPKFMISVEYTFSNGAKLNGIIDIEAIMNDITKQFDYSEQKIAYLFNEEFIYSQNIDSIYFSELMSNKTIDIDDNRYEVVYIENDYTKISSVYLYKKNVFSLEYFPLDIYSTFWLVLTLLLLIFAVIAFFMIRTPINKYLVNISKYHGGNSKDLPNSMMKNPFISNLHSTLKLVEDKISNKKTSVMELSKLNDEKSLSLSSSQLALSSTLTQRREIENELNNYLSNYKDILQLLPDNIFIIKGNGVVEYINNHFLQILNFQPEEIINKSLNRFIVNSDVCFSLLVERDFDGIELVFKQKNSNEEIKLSVKTQRIFVDGELQAILCVCRDVSFLQRMNFDYYSKNRELYIVNEISKIMTINVDVERILQNITAKISALLDLKGCTIRFLQDNKLELVAYEGYQSDIIKHEIIDAEKTHAGLSLKEGKIYIIRSKDDLVFPEERLQDAIDNSDTLVFLPLATDDNKFGVLSVASDHQVENDDLVLLESISTNATIALEKTILFKELKENYFKTVEALLTAIEINTEDKDGHIHHVANLARLIGEHFYFTSSELDDIYIAGMLHDIDKIGMSDSNQYDEQLRSNLRKEIVETIGLNESIQNGVIFHKLDYDLSNSNLDLNEQPFYAKIIKISNEYEKAYREFSEYDDAFERAFAKIKEGSKKQFAPEMIRVLSKIIRDSKDKLTKAFE